MDDLARFFPGVDIGESRGRESREQPSLVLENQCTILNANWAFLESAESGILRLFALASMDGVGRGHIECYLSRGTYKRGGDKLGRLG